MSREIPVDLVATRGRLLPPEAVPPRPQPAPDKPPVAPAAETPTKDDKPADPSHSANCKHCGWNQTLDPIQPDAEDAQAFRDAVFKGEPYQKAFVLMGGAVTVVYRDMSSTEGEAVRVKVSADMARQSLPFEAVGAMLTDLRLGFAVKEIRCGETVLTLPPAAAPAEETDGRRLKVVQEACKTDVVYRAVRWHYGVFEAQLAILLSRAADRSFFSATGSRGGSPASPPVG